MACHSISISIFHLELVSKKDGSGKRAKHSKTSSSHTPTLPPEYSNAKNLIANKSISQDDDVAFNTKLYRKVKFDPKNADVALYNSDNSYHLCFDTPTILVKLNNIKRDVDSISFNTEGHGSVRVDIIDQYETSILKVSSVS